MLEGELYLQSVCSLAKNALGYCEHSEAIRNVTKFRYVESKPRVRSSRGILHFYMITETKQFLNSS